MLLSTLFHLTSAVLVTLAAPFDPQTNAKAAINSRFATYQNEKRSDNAPVKAEINSRFATYELEKKDNPQLAEINSRFATYELEKRGEEDARAEINSRFATYQV
ncbi:MAG: hypothetical protein Q9227_006826 [Pyrenula ochraceoflavens]